MKKKLLWLVILIFVSTIIVTLQFKEIEIGNDNKLIVLESDEVDASTEVTMDVIETETTTENYPESFVSSWGETYTASIPVSYPENGQYISFKDYLISERIFNLDRTHISLGYDKDKVVRDDKGRPLMFVNLQKVYGDKYSVSFIGSEEKVIYLTFTMGYEHYNEGIPNTQRIMDICMEKNVPCIFFVDGGYTQVAPDLCKKIVENGFELGCHGWAHPSDGIATHSLAEQLEDVNLIWHRIYELTGTEPKYYRFGNSIWNERALALLDSLGFKTVFHTFTYKDWDIYNQPNPGTTLQMMIDNLHSGEIVYLHTVSNTSVEVLPEFIDAARERGYEFEMVPYN